MDIPSSPQQAVLNRDQLDAFDFDGFVESQYLALRMLVSENNIYLDANDYIVDIGGGRGYFAKRISALHSRVRVYETDPKSIDHCYSIGIEARLVDAVRPEIMGDEKIICFNLILHHLIGSTDTETRRI